VSGTGPLLLVGCGKMGGALLAGWLDQGMAADEITVIEPLAEVSADVTTVSEAAALPVDFTPAVTVVAVKPQTMDQALAPLAGRDAVAGGLVLSIAAGKTIGYFERIFSAQTAIVRAMPNTPAAVGRGIAVLSASAAVTQAGRQLCGQLMSAVGEIAWVEDEGLMDAVTATSGSGPAYVFLLIETLAEAAAAAGLEAGLALRLAQATVSGAGELARLADESATQLRQNVTSPGGTTAAALEVLMAGDGLQPLMTRAVAAATRRSRELAG
jgi:pyrroline-5-carboxylate reductase